MTALADALRAAQARADYLARIKRDAEDEQCAYEAAQEWEAFFVDLRVRRPVSEYRLNMADHE